MKKSVLSILVYISFQTYTWSQAAPSWDFATSIGGAGVDYANDVVTDSSGNVFVIGSFNGTQMEIGSLTEAGKGGYDIFVAKFSPTGTPVWLKALGSIADDFGFAITSDGADIYCTGTYKNQLYYTSTNFVALNGLANKSNIVVFKMEGATGNVIWANSSGGTGVLAYDLFPRDIAISSTGAVLVAGTTEGQVRWGTTSVSFTVVDTCNGCGFVSAWGKNAGAYSWTYTIRPTSINTTSSIRQISLDQYNNIYAIGNFRNLSSGSTAQAIFPNNPLYTTGTPGQTNLTGLGNQDFFLMKLGPDGLFLFAKSGGKSGSASFTDGNTLWVDKADQSVYLGGAFRDSYFYSGSTAGSVNISGGNGFLIKTDLNGNEIWERHTTTTSATGGNSVNSISGNGNGGVYLGISAQATCDWYGQTAQGNTTDFSQVLFARVGPSGNTLWGKKLDPGNFHFLNPPTMFAIKNSTSEGCWMAGNHDGFGIMFDTKLVQGNNFSSDGFVSKLGNSTPSTGIFSNNNIFKLYPNPSSSSEINIAFSQVLDGKICIVDCKGAKVLEEKFRSKQHLNFNPQLLSGIYFIQITTNTGCETLKWVIE